MPDSGAYVVASEPSSFDLIDAKYVRDIEPGEMVIIDKQGIRSLRPFPEARRKSCIFEYVYFSRPDSILDGISVYEARKNLGRQLAKLHGVEADVVIPVPDSGVPATIGYAEESKLPFELALRGPYVHRAAGQHSAFRRALEAEPGRGRARRQAHRGRGRQHRARHHQP
jgi:amidophosphoribosyltransferase